MSTQQTRSKGALITLEGIEGSGKTTQAARLCQFLRASGHHVLHTREPGGTRVAERLRAVLLDRSTESIAPETEAFLILAARRQHVDHVIKPALQQGLTVVCDRFSESTFAYQGYARGLDVTLLRNMNTWATGGLTPDLTLVFDLPVAAGLRRRQRDHAPQNRLDREAERFHRKVRTGFLQLARREPKRIKIVDAAQPADAVGASVEAFVTKWLTARRSRKRPRS